MSIESRAIAQQNSVVEGQVMSASSNTINPFAETRRKTVLEGVKVGGVGKDLRIGQKIRGWVVLPNSGYPDDHPESKDVIGYNFELRARINGLEEEPELLLVGRSKDGVDPLLVPQSSIERGHYGAFEFGTLNEPVELSGGKVVEGVNLSGKRKTFIVAKYDGQPVLEDLDTSDQIKPYTKDKGRLMIAGGYRVMVESMRDLAMWAQETGENGVRIKSVVETAAKTP